MGKTKNVETNLFGETLGRLHMERQDFSKLAQRKGKAVKADRKRKAGDALEDDGGAGGEEAAAAASRAAAIEAAVGELAAEEADEKAERRAAKKAKKARLTAGGGSGEFDA